jgi:hypothetical protein
MLVRLIETVTHGACGCKDMMQSKRCAVAVIRAYHLLSAFERMTTNLDRSNLPHNGDVLRRIPLC